MGAYLDIFEYTVAKSKRYIMKILIEPSFREAVCFQIHQMQDDSFMLFWNFELHTKHFVPLMRKFAKTNNLPPDATIEDVLENPDFKKVVLENAPVSSTLLNLEDITLIRSICNSPLPIDVDYPIGLDGHSYTFTIFSDPRKILRCWLIIPKEYEMLIPLVNMLVRYANLDPERYGPGSYNK